MPTANRSSNTDPRDMFIRLNPLGLGEEELRKDSTGFEDQRTHSDYLLFLAGYRESQQSQQHNAEPGYPPCDYCGITPDYHPWHGSGLINGFENRHIHACDGCRGQLPSHLGQPHPEPIAWMVGTAFWWTKEEAERDAAETGLPIVGLGPMTGSADIDQLQLEIAKLQLDLTMHDAAAIQDECIRAENSELRAKLDERDAALECMTTTATSYKSELAERDALLRDALNSHGVMLMTDPPQDPWKTRRISERIREALSANAEPSVDYGPTPGCKQCEEAEACGLTDCPECDAQLCEDVNGDGIRPGA